ncbi:hypothetical protein POM88_028354 [Heracleum sosnowskyi]|uniref:Leucine zipper homeobox-associated domain-containing protein n=1 Tax=Heracleum sosnowskyi TaxID=360622 RepID=A0AAD8ICU1_9APIA|nr:hypothetical protein POM88_028354 [Heracleum sosnowskyi]
MKKAEAESYDKLKLDNDNLRKENNKLKIQVESLKELKVEYDKLCTENERLMNEVKSLKQTEDLCWPQLTSKPVVEFDPHYAIQFKPNLCPRFPQRRETLPIDAGFAQTRVLKKILSHYDFKTFSPEHYVPDSGLVSPTIAPSVVAVSSFFGVERKFDCSGLVIHWSSSKKEATILTSAKLLWNPEDSDFEFHLVVRMADGTLLLAKEEHVDYYHNLLTLKVNPTLEPGVVDLRSRRANIVDGMKVISLSREFNNSVLRDSIGELSLERAKFGCDELLTSNCGICEIDEGGPLVTDEGYVVGINFLGRQKYAHPLPTATIISCLEMWNSCCTVVRPWFGIRVADVYEVCKVLSIPFQKKILADRELYVLADEVYEGSVAHRNNVSLCDSIYTLSGIRLESAKQYSQLLSEASRAATAGESGHPLMAVIIPDDRPTTEINIEAEYIPVDDKRFSNCWPQVKVDEWLRLKGGLENPGLCWLPEEGNIH